MTEIPAPVNKPADTAESIIHAAIFEVAIKEAQAAIVAAIPALGAPIINSIVSQLLNWFGGFIYKALARFATFQVINFETAAEKDAYFHAEGALHAAHLSGDPNALASATKEFKIALARIVHIDGAAPV